MTASETLAHVDAADFYQRVGEITRQLHDAMRELGYDRQIEATLGSLPDAKARLSFIARKTGESAEKVLNTVDSAREQQDALLARADSVEALLGQPGCVPEAELRGFLHEVRTSARTTGSQLTEIMLAQDFHDLTGQTVTKVVDMASRLEDSLVNLLLEASPPGTLVVHGPLDGPVADPSARTDVVANQAQVDELLESLGF